MATATTTTTSKRRLPWRTLILFAIAAAATFIFLALADELREGDLDKHDVAMAMLVHRLENPVLDVVMITFTEIGTAPALLAVSAAVALWAYRRGKKSYILLIAANLVIAMVLNPILKAYFSRARPTLFEVIKRPDTYSFPSGHSMSAVCIYGALAAVAIALRPERRALFVPCALILMIGIGVSRVYLGVHWPSDVIAGWASGMPFLVATVHLVHRAKRLQAA